MKLIIDKSGSYVETNSLRFPNETMLECLWHFKYADRLEFDHINWSVLGFNAAVLKDPTLESAANDILRRENAELRRDNEALRSGWRPGDLQSATQYARVMRENSELRYKLDGLAEANTRQLRQNEGLRNDVKQAESHYEAASKRLKTMRGQMAAVTSVLNGTNIMLDYDSHTPILELAREVVAGSNRRWELYRETMERLVQLGKDVELIKRQSTPESFEPPW